MERKEIGNTMDFKSFFNLFAYASLAAVIRLNAAQPGSLDTSFDPGSGANDLVKQVVVLGNGKILIAGYFTTINGVPRNGIARLESNGALDTSFDPGTGADQGLSAIAIQPDGKIVIGGEFTRFDGTTRGRVARLTENGKLDASFDPGSGVRGTESPAVLSLALQNDGKVLIGGLFTNVNGVVHNHLARLEPDGRLDTTFNARLDEGDGKGVFSIRTLSNGQIIAGGVFTSINGVNRSAVARFNPDGGLDTSFNANLDNFSLVVAVEVASSQRIIIGGYFVNTASSQLISIAALNNDGSMDNSFRAETPPDNQVNSVTIQPDGKVIVGGYFHTLQGTTRGGVARLNSDGSLDRSFDTGFGVSGMANSGLLSVALQPDGNIMIAGAFTRVNRTSRNGIARLYGDELTAPVITIHPASRSVCAGENVTFNVGAGGSGLTYQWRKNGTSVPGATTASFTIAAVGQNDAGSYDVVVTGTDGTATSNPATLSINSSVSISGQPSSQMLCAGSSASFNISLSGSGPFSYQWRKDGNAIPGQTTATLTLNSIGASDAGTYDVLVNGACGSITSDPATLAINSATISRHPASQTVCAGGSATFNVTVNGNGPFGYQWRKGGNTIAGQTSPTLTLNSVSAADVGVYDVIVSGPCGTAVSTSAELTLCTPGALRLESVDRTTGNGFELRVSGETGRSYQVQSSTDLKQWTVWTNLQLSTPLQTLLDLRTNSTSYRFYRATTP